MSNWSEFQKNCWVSPDGSYAIDYSQLPSEIRSLDSSKKMFQRAYTEMAETEAGAIMNPDESRMVGHYWLRDSSKAPSEETKVLIDTELGRIESFVNGIHSKKRFDSVLSIGIGGSALGPQLMSECFRYAARPLQFFSIDNTDPDGIAQVLDSIPALKKTLVLVISKSGGTKETRNGMLLAERAFKKAGLSFCEHAVAITGSDSILDKKAKKENWLETFPMWDWVGGRTSLWSAVGLLPAALIGIDTGQLLAGAAAMDEMTREPDLENNPAGILAHTWFALSATKDMVVLPYRDRLLLLSRYLQQLIMESLGKRYDRDGKEVFEGLSVYGNKGSTDQHAYIQQLRDGRNNFFALFVEVLKDTVDLPSEQLREFQAVTLDEVEPGITSSDYLQGFLLGTREALSEDSRFSLTITLEELSPYSLGGLLALFERAVSFYATFANINAYHQPGVEAGKKAAERVISLQQKVMSLLQESENSLTVEKIATDLDSKEHVHIFKILQRLSINGAVEKIDGGAWHDYHYAIKSK